MMKKWYQILHTTPFIHYYKPPFIDIDPLQINCFYMKKPVSSHNIIIAILVILSYKNKTKRKNIHEEKKTLMTTFSYMNKTTKVILLSTFFYYFLLVFNTHWLEKKQFHSINNCWWRYSISPEIKKSKFAIRA